MEITGKKAVVVGGASGMARAAAQRLHERGAQIAIMDLESSDGAAVAESLGGTFHPCDVTDHEGTEIVLREAVEALGGLHISINTAGGGIGARTVGRDGPHDLAAFQKIIDLNLIATFNICRLSAAHMVENEPEDEERGVMITTASIAAFEGQIGQVAYTAAKAGIAGMMLTMARDLGSLGVRAVAVAPSLFATGLTAGAPEEIEKSLTKDAAFPRRMGRPDEYAKLAVAIVENPMLNGGCIRLDAGQRFGPKM